MGREKNSYTTYEDNIKTVCVDNINLWGHTCLFSFVPYYYISDSSRTARVADRTWRYMKASIATKQHVKVGR